MYMDSIVLQSTSETIVHLTLFPVILTRLDIHIVGKIKPAYPTMLVLINTCYKAYRQLVSSS